MDVDESSSRTNSYQASPSGSDGGESSSRQPHDEKTDKGAEADVMARFRVIKKRLDNRDDLGSSSYEPSYESKLIKPNEIDAPVMARLRVLKERLEILDSGNAEEYPEYLHLVGVGGDSGTKETVCSCLPGNRNDVGQKCQPLEFAGIGMVWQNQQAHVGVVDCSNGQHDELNTMMVDVIDDITMASYNILKRRLVATDYLGECNHRQGHEVNMNGECGVDASTMAKLEVLKGRTDYSNSCHAERQPELLHFSDVGGDSSNRKCGEGNTMMVDVIDDITRVRYNSLKRRLDATNYLGECSHKQRNDVDMNGEDDVDASTMARLEVLNARTDYPESG